MDPIGITIPLINQPLTLLSRLYLANHSFVRTVYRHCTNRGPRPSKPKLGFCHLLFRVYAFWGTLQPASSGKHIFQRYPGIVAERHSKRTGRLRFFKRKTNTVSVRLCISVDKLRGPRVERSCATANLTWCQ